MKNKICKCGHRNSEHNIIRNLCWYNHKATGYSCTCKKFEPQEVCSNCNLEECKCWTETPIDFKNHSHPEEAQSSSGSDNSPQHKNRVSLKDGANQDYKPEDTLSSKIYENIEGFTNKKRKSIKVPDVKDFIQKLKEELFHEAIARKRPLTDSSLDRLPLNYIKRIIDKLAGEDLI